MTAPAPNFNYRVVSQVDKTKTDVLTGRAVEGTVITFVDGITGDQGSVFLQNSAKSVENAQLLIENQLEIMRGIGALGE